MGFIPDGNRRWAEGRGLPKEAGYAAGVRPALALYKECQRLGVKEVSCYGFTEANTHRPSAQVRAFQRALVGAVDVIKGLDASVLVVGDTSSKQFPRELLPYTKRTVFNRGTMKVNVLANYSWEWDVRAGNGHGNGHKGLQGPSIGSEEIPRIDLVVRWGGRRRLSGFLPVQSAYADIYVCDALWPDFEPKQFEDAVRWYAAQDVTLGG